MPRILVVDDEEVFLSSLVEGLSDLEPHWVIDSTTSGEQALQLLTKHHYELVVTDLRMPGVDGFAILAQLTQLEPTPSVIVLSAYLSPSAEQPLQEAFVDRVLEKPVDLFQLHEAMRACLAETTKGTLEGISLATVFQLLEMEQRTCTLKVEAGGKTGFVYYRGGKVLDARAEELSGDEAFFEILSWPRPRVSFSSFCPVRKQKIGGSVTALLLEAAKNADERSQAKQEAAVPFEPTTPPSSVVPEQLVTQVRKTFAELSRSWELPLALLLASPREVLFHWPPGVTIPETETLRHLLAAAPDLGAALAPSSPTAAAVTHLEAERGHIFLARIALENSQEPFPPAVTLAIFLGAGSPVPLLREKLLQLCQTTLRGTGGAQANRRPLP